MKAPAENKQNAKPQQLNIGEAGKENRIIFLTMQISLEESIRDVYRIEKKEVINVAGSVKKQQLDEYSAEPGYLFCELLNAENVRVDFIRIPDPLQRVYEFSEPGSNQLDKKTFSSQSAEFSVRFNYNSSVKYLAIYKMNSSSRNLKKIYYASF